MARPKLIIIEGADGTGKSTQAGLLAKHFDAKIVSQPSPNNIIGFVRAEAKKNPNMTGFERQLLIAISHTVDAYSEFKGDRNIVMDRSWISGLVYGKLTGLDNYNMATLEHLLSTIYKSNVGTLYDTTIFFMDADKRLDEPDDDVFEGQINWLALKAEYLQIHQRALKKTTFFAEDEKVKLVSLPKESSIEEVFLYLKGIVQHAI